MDELIAALRSRLQTGLTPCHNEEAFSPREVASKDAIIAAEENLGFALCPLLKRIYTEVANGGFGPGSGIIGVGNGYTDDWGYNLEDLYHYFTTRQHYDPSWHWPAGLLPFCHWGYTTYSCVDSHHSRFPVLIIDPGYREPGDDMEEVFIEHKDSIADWFHDWLAGNDLWADVFSQ